MASSPTKQGIYLTGTFCSVVKTYIQFRVWNYRNYLIWHLVDSGWLSTIYYLYSLPEGWAFKVGNLPKSFAFPQHFGFPWKPVMQHAIPTASFNGNTNLLLDYFSIWSKDLPIWHICRYADTPVLVIADMPILPIFSRFKFTEKGVDSDSNPDLRFLVPITPLLIFIFPQAHVLQKYEKCTFYFNESNIQGPTLLMHISLVLESWIFQFTRDFP